MLVRTWNVFHGNSKPPERHAFLEEMVRLATRDRPDVLCLQEVPAWALPELGAWSGMTTLGDVASRPAIGPIPSTAKIGGVITALNHGMFRSAFTGQANAILLAPPLRVLERRVLELNPRSFRRVQAQWLGLGLVGRLAWARERRICQAARVAVDGTGTAVVANLHATSYPPDRRLPDAELLRAATFVDGMARPREPVVLAGDFNVGVVHSRTLRDLAMPEWGLGGATPGGIDHVLVRGFRSATPPRRWPRGRRRHRGRLLSDHAPVEVRVQ